MFPPLKKCQNKLGPRLCIDYGLMIPPSMFKCIIGCMHVTLCPKIADLQATTWIIKHECKAMMAIKWYRFEKDVETGGQ